MDLLVECMEKKNGILDLLKKQNEIQEKLIKDENFDLDEFDKTVEDKGKLIDNLQKLDEGFESLYEKVRETVTATPTDYKEQLAKMQELIREMTEKSMSLQAEEERNKKLIETRFKKEKQQIKMNRSQSRVAQDYYNSMNKLNYVTPQFWDKKK